MMLYILMTIMTVTSPLVKLEVSNNEKHINVHFTTLCITLNDKNKSNRTNTRVHA